MTIIEKRIGSMLNRVGNQNTINIKNIERKQDR